MGADVFLPVYWNVILPGGRGGAAFGDINQKLAGGGSGKSSAGPSESGGGAVEIGATGQLTVSGSILANGENGYFYGAGGGSGGAIFLHGSTVNISGNLAANGGIGSSASSGLTWAASGGNGGGGRVAIDYSTPYQFYVDGGTLAIGNGVFTLNEQPAAFSSVPEPSPLILAAVVSMLGFAGARLRKIKFSASA